MYVDIYLFTVVHLSHYESLRAGSRFFFNFLSFSSRAIQSVGSQVVICLRQEKYRNRDYAFNNFYRDLAFLWHFYQIIYPQWIGNRQPSGPS